MNNNGFFAVLLCSVLAVSGAYGAEESPGTVLGSSDVVKTINTQTDKVLSQPGLSSGDKRAVMRARDLAVKHISNRPGLNVQGGESPKMNAGAGNSDQRPIEVGGGAGTIALPRGAPVNTGSRMALPASVNASVLRPAAPPAGAAGNTNSRTVKPAVTNTPVVVPPLPPSEPAVNTNNKTVAAIDNANTRTAPAVAASPVSGAAKPPRGAVIDLGEYGKLIAPVQVNGKWYYAWDMNGDGAHNLTYNRGKYAGNGAVSNASATHRYAEDRASHDVINALFTKDINGVTGGGKTTDTYRYAIYNGLHAALPTLGGITGGYAGAYIPNNGLYRDIAAVWDKYNYSNPANGTPPGWYPGNYLSATVSSKGHVLVAVNGGFITDAIDSTYGFVMLEVLP